VHSRAGQAARKGTVGGVWPSLPAEAVGAQKSGDGHELEPTREIALHDLWAEVSTFRAPNGRDA